MDRPISLSWRRLRAFPLAVALGLAACGGGGGGTDGSSAPAGGGTSPQSTTPAEEIPTAAEAARFLTQSTFGPTEVEINVVADKGYEAYLDQQISFSSASHVQYMDNRLAQKQLSNPSATIGANEFYESFWLYAATSPAQLRERMKFALSQIFVISLSDNNIHPRAAAAYYDMLGIYAFGNYRDLLEQVALHPMMGRYLSHLGNQKEDASTGRNPDENFAREILQLMSIGVHELNMDGTVRRDSSGAPIAAYTSNDISGLAKVFTGFSYNAAVLTNQTFTGGGRTQDTLAQPMAAYSNYHSTSAKNFLGVSISAGSSDARADLKIALDAIANHPNTPPFICKQLIQRFVTSNPTPAYVGRCSAVFVRSSTGTRGDLGEVIKAILLDKEARTTKGISTTSGKLREPIIRMTNWMRAFRATSASGRYQLNSTSSNISLNQAALTAPSVFNFYRPGYVAPNTRLAAQNLASPEFQIVNEVTVAGYANTMQAAIGSGIGTSNDVRSDYASEVAVAADANALADRMNRLLLYGQMSPSLRARIVESVNSVALPAGTATNQPAVSAAMTNRAKLAVFMTMISPEYLIQR